AMLQKLLEDRFQIKIHREKKDLPVYALEVAKGGLKMQKSPPDANQENADPRAPVSLVGGGSSQGVSVSLGRGSSFTVANNRFEGKKLTMAALAGTLERFLDRPIVDMTNLHDSYDITLDVAPEDYAVMLVRSAVAAGVILPPEALRVLDRGTPSSVFD